MNILIVGPGAMGCLFAALLQKAVTALKKDAHQIILLDKNPDRAAKINKIGLTVEGISGNWKIHVKTTADIKTIQKTDLIILCVKAYDTKEAVTCIKPIVTNDTLVLTLQNGVGNIETISDIIGPEAVIGGVTNLGATLLNTGCVRHAGKGETVIGRIDGKVPVEIRTIREIFNKAGLDLKISRDITGLLWSKLIINVGINALTAITRLRNGKLTEFEGTHKILKDAVTEAVKVAKRKRIKLIYDDPLAKVEAVCEATGSNVSSMLQDVLKKKKTEIDYINAVIIRQAQSLSIPVPVNSMLVDIVKTIESSYAAAVLP